MVQFTIRLTLPFHEKINIDDNTITVENNLKSYQQNNGL